MTKRAFCNGNEPAASCQYLMENDQETLRLELKTDTRIVEKQAKWAGIQKGMRVADVGCGSGKTTRCLNKLVQPGGETVGIDISGERIEYARSNNTRPGITYECADICGSLKHLGLFDFIWLRFILEYHKSESVHIVQNLREILKPGGIICLIDLDYNCLTHYGISPRLRKTIETLMQLVEIKNNFDPYAGRKLYSYLYDLGFQNISMDLAAHHLIYGDLNEVDEFNWTKKIQVAGKLIGYPFDEYEGGYEEFLTEFNREFRNPRRFTYTPVICCRGQKPG